MPTVKLTTRGVKAAQYEGDGASRYVLWDAADPGFGLRIYPSGKKTFVLSYRSPLDRRKRMKVLGNFGTFTVDQARDRARRQLAMVRDGKDPIDEASKAAQGKTLDDLIEAYMERHAKVHKRTWPADERRLRLHIPKDWRRRKAKTITRAEVADLHNKFGLRAPYEANRLLEVLRKMFNLARVWGFLEEAAPNPAKGIQKFKEHKRKRFVKADELPRLAKAIDQEENIYVRAAIWLFILTGVRRTELLSARWDQVEWATSRLRLPETKSGDEQFATLSGPAMAILQGIPKFEDNPFILPGARKGKPLVNISKPWGRIREVAGLPDVRLHDLRRTVGSWLSQSGVDLNLIRDALRHASISTTLTYARLGEDAARDVMEDHGRRILEAAGDHGPLKVVDGGKVKK